MKSGKISGILMLVVLLSGAAFYFSEQEVKKSKDQEAGVFFLSGLLGKVNNVAKVVVIEKETTTHLYKKDDRWLVEEKSDYDAEFVKVKALLLGLAELETIESKTSKPENYGRLGVQSPNEEGEESSRQIQLYDKAGNLIHALIVGKSKPSRVQGAKPATYVRQIRDATSWLVSGKIEIPGSQLDWLDKSIINLSESRIQSITILHADDSQLTIRKAEKTDANFAVANLPTKAELKSEAIANSVANVLQNLLFEDIQKRGEFSADDKKITNITFSTFDGLQLMAKLINENDKYFLWFDAKTESQDEKIAAESTALNAKFALWVYEITEFKATNFMKKLEDLIKTEG